MRPFFHCLAVSSVPFSSQVTPSAPPLLLPSTSPFPDLLKLPRLLRIGKLTKKLDQLAGANAFRILWLLFFFVLLAHILACAWWFVGVELYTCAIHHGCSFSVDEVWIPHFLLRAPEEVPTSEAYIRSLYFTLTTMTTVGYGQPAAVNDTERIVVCVMLIIAAASYAIIFGNVSVQLQELDKAMTQFNKRSKVLKEYVKLHNMDGDMEERLQVCHSCCWCCCLLASATSL